MIIPALSSAWADLYAPGAGGHRATLTTHYSPSPNSPFDGAMILRGRRSTICECDGGEARSFVRRLKRQEMTSRAPFAATHGTFCPGLDVLLIHLLEATDVNLPGKSTLVRRILDDRTAATSAPSGRGAATPALLSITIREVRTAAGISAHYPNRKDAGRLIGLSSFRRELRRAGQAA